MIRYRPPQKSGSKYITAEGALLLKKELNQLWKIERPKVTQQVSEAAALGDRTAVPGAGPVGDGAPFLPSEATAHSRHHTSVAR